MKHIPGKSLNLLTGLIRDLELAFQDDFHLIEGVFVHEWGPFFQTVETGRDGFFGVVAVTIPYLVSDCLAY